MTVIGWINNRARNTFFGWWVVLGGFIVQMLGGGLLFNGFGAYFVLLQQEFGWSKTVLSGAFSLTRVESGILGPFQGWLIDRLGTRTVVMVGTVIFGVGFMLMSRINSLPTFYLTFLMMALGSSLGGFMAISACVANWFVKKRATAMGIAMTGMGIGGIMIPALAWSLNTHGWRTTAFASGVVIIVIGLPATLLLRHKPEEYGYLPDGETPDNTGPSSERAFSSPSLRRSTAIDAANAGFSVREALRTPAFWLVSIGHAAALLVVGAMMVHLIPHLVESIGLSLQKAAMVVSVVTAMDITGRLLGGYLGDRINKRIGVAGCLLGHAVALAILAYSTSLAPVILFAIIHGLAWGIRGPLIMSLRADYFGRVAYATILGFSSLIMMLGMVVGPLLAGFMADRLGNYRLGFTILAGLAALGSVLFLITRRPAPPVRAPRTGSRGRATS